MWGMDQTRAPVERAHALDSVCKRGAVAIATAPGARPTSVGSARVEDQAGSRGECGCMEGQRLRAPWVLVCVCVCVNVEEE